VYSQHRGKLRASTSSPPYPKENESDETVILDTLICTTLVVITLTVLRRPTIVSTAKTTLVAIGLDGHGRQSAGHVDAS
jgi:hypothetical protein